MPLFNLGSRKKPFPVMKIQMLLDVTSLKSALQFQMPENIYSFTQAPSLIQKGWEVLSQKIA